MAGPDWDGSTGSIYEPLESVSLAAHWIREVRQRVGPEIGLSIDFHHRLSVAKAAIFCQQIGDLGLMFLEEPIRAENPQAYRRLRQMTPIPFAIDEELASKWEFLPFIEEGLLNYARVDLSNVSGFSAARKVAGWCEAHYLAMMPHNPLGPVTTAASVHYGIATSNFAQLEHNLTRTYSPELFPEMMELDGTGFALPLKPGLGVTFNAEAAADDPYQNWAAPRWRRRDGAHTDW